MIDVKIDSQGRVREVRPLRIPWLDLACVILLAALAVGAAVWLRGLTRSITGYQPAVNQQLPPGSPTQPLAQQLVFIVVDGLRYDTSTRMPVLSSLRERGAWARAEVPAPSLSQPSWTTLVTGAGPELSGTPLLNAPLDQVQPISSDHLFARAKEYGLATGLAASDERWSRLIEPAWRDVTFVAEDGTSAERDRETADAAVEFLRNYSADFLLVHFDQVDQAGHEYGGASAEYEDIAGQVDKLIAQVVSAVDLQKAVVIVTSDHGHLNQGGHGGTEASVSQVPFVMAGRQVVPGTYGPISQTDIAPTVAAVLGTAIPAAAQGQIRFEMLDMSPELRVEKALAEGEQRLALGETVLGHLGSGGTVEMLGEETASLGVVRTSMELGNLESAFNLAIPTVRRIDIAVQATRLEKILGEQNRRWLLALAVAVLPLIAWWWRRSLLTSYLTLVAIFAFTFPLGQGRLWGLVSDMAPTLTNVVMQVGVAIALGLVVVLGWLWWQRDRRAGQLMSVLLIGALAVGAYFGLLTSPGGTYTPSAISSIGGYAGELVGRVLLALALGGIIVVAGLWWEGETRVQAMVRASYGFVLLLAFGLVQGLALCYWRQGQAVSWYLPDPNWLFLQATTLAELALVAGLGLALPLFTYGTIRLLTVVNLRVIPRLEERIRARSW